MKISKKNFIWWTLIVLGLWCVSCNKRTPQYPRYKPEPKEKIIRTDVRTLTQHR